VELLVLDRETFEQLRDEQPSLYAALLERLLASLARTTVRLDLEARAVAR
jgi:CRP-like cAMP-binding protein